MNFIRQFLNTHKKTLRVFLFLKDYLFDIYRTSVCVVCIMLFMCVTERVKEPMRNANIMSHHRIKQILFCFFFFYFFNKHKMHPRYAFLNTNSTLCKHKRVTIAPPRIRRAYLRVYLNIFVVSTPCTVILLYFFFCRYITVTRV